MTGHGLLITTEWIVDSDAETTNVLYRGATYRQYVFHRDHKDVVCDQPVPVSQDALDGL